MTARTDTFENKWREVEATLQEVAAEQRRCLSEINREVTSKLLFDDRIEVIDTKFSKVFMCLMMSPGRLLGFMVPQVGSKLVDYIWSCNGFARITGKRTVSVLDVISEIEMKCTKINRSRTTISTCGKIFKAFEVFMGIAAVLKYEFQISNNRVRLENSKLWGCTLIELRIAAYSCISSFSSASFCCSFDDFLSERGNAFYFLGFSGGMGKGCSWKGCCEVLVWYRSGASECRHLGRIS